MHSTTLQTKHTPEGEQQQGRPMSRTGCSAPAAATIAIHVVQEPRRQMARQQMTRQRVSLGSCAVAELGSCCWEWSLAACSISVPQLLHYLYFSRRDCNSCLALSGVWHAHMPHWS